MSCCSARAPPVGHPAPRCQAGTGARARRALPWCRRPRTLRRKRSIVSMCATRCPRMSRRCVRGRRRGHRAPAGAVSPAFGISTSEARRSLGAGRGQARRGAQVPSDRSMSRRRRRRRGPAARKARVSHGVSRRLTAALAQAAVARAARRASGMQCTLAATRTGRLLRASRGWSLLRRGYWPILFCPLREPVTVSGALPGRTTLPEEVRRSLKTQQHAHLRPTLGRGVCPGSTPSLDGPSWVDRTTVPRLTPSCVPELLVYLELPNAGLAGRAWTRGSLPTRDEAQVSSVAAVAMSRP